MSDYEMMQWAGIFAGCVVFVVIVVAIVRFSLKQGAIWPDCARQFGLVFKEQDVGNAFTSRSERQKSMEGIAQGVPVRVVESSERIGGTTRTGTRVFGRSMFPSAHQFALQVEKFGNRAAHYHVVQTGDPTFDRCVVVKSDAPDAARALLQPPVRAAILELPMSSIALSYDRGELCVSYAGMVTSARELEVPLRLVIAAAGARLA
jgi:hypothetical protein